MKRKPMHPHRKARGAAKRAVTAPVVTIVLCHGKRMKPRTLSALKGALASMSSDLMDRIMRRALDRAAQNVLLEVRARNPLRTSR